MGLFRFTAEEKSLRDCAGALANVVGQVSCGNYSSNYLVEMLEVHAGQLQTAHAAVVATKGPRAALKIMRENGDIAAIWAGDTPGAAARARSLLEETCASLGLAI